MDIPDDLSNTDIKLNANQAYGGYQNIALVDIYNGKFTTEQIVQDPIQVISKEDSFVGCYADTDGNGSIDGIIYADLLVGMPDTGYWEASESYESGTGIYSLPTDVTTLNVKDYVKSNTAVTDSRFDSTARYIVSLANTSTGTKRRFYVMGLDDLADVASSPLISQGWHIPSTEEWSAFGDAFNLTTENYNQFGLITNSDSDYYKSAKETYADEGYIFAPWCGAIVKHDDVDGGRLSLSF